MLVMKKILIVEDDQAIGEVEKDYLELSGFDVTLESDGLAGLQQAVSGDYDLIILDVMLPGVDGFKLAERIREKHDTPIMIVSARTGEIDKLKGLGLGIDDYITKPFSPHELVARTKAHLKRYEMIKASAGTTPKQKIEIRGLVIYPETREIFMNGDPIDLTVKEYEILVLLASAPNKVFTKDEIFTKVWGYDSDRDLPTLTVHIRKLREKIEFNPSKPEYVQTVWGVGYKIVKSK